jgi:FkbM family methyltransferase
LARLLHNQEIKTDFRALLIDADMRCINACARFIDLNNLRENFSFVHGLISRGHGSEAFALTGVMAPARVQDAGDLGYDQIDGGLQDQSKEPSENQSKDQSKDQIIQVRIISESEIERLMRPPYDLIKLDVEGAEYDFLTGYQNILRCSKHLLLEWHSWHGGGGGIEQIKETASKQGFLFVSELQAPRSVMHQGRACQCGLLLFANTNLK